MQHFFGSSLYLPIMQHFFGSSLYPVKVFTGHVGLWTRVRILPRPVKIFTRHKPFPILFISMFGIREFESKCFYQKHQKHSNYATNSYLTFNIIEDDSPNIITPNMYNIWNNYYFLQFFYKCTANNNCSITYLKHCQAEVYNDW